MVKGFLEPLSGHLLGWVVVTLPATRFTIQIFHSADTVLLCVWEHRDYRRVWHYLIRFF